MSAPRSLPSTNVTRSDLARLRVLVLDDHGHTARLMADVLRAGGVGEVYASTDAEAALTGLHAHNPDIIFTDRNMPNMDGLTFTRTIRQAALRQDSFIPNPQVPVVMVSASATLLDVELARLAGVNEFVLKPFTPAALLSRIQMVLRKPRRFVVSEAYVGPDRRRKAEVDYSGPMRRRQDPVEVSDAGERNLTRQTIAVELNALKRMIRARRGIDRSLMQMTYRVMQHTRFRALQVRDQTIVRTTNSLLGYIDSMGGAEACDAEIVEVHIDAVLTLMGVDESDVAQAERINRDLELTVEYKAKQKLAVAV
jgi:CheY-like chemotaxis protein